MMNKPLLGLIIAAVVFPTSVVAQLVLEEVVVTAQRREQSMQDVPVSLTAFSGDIIKQTNITEASDYLALTPNVSFTDGFSTGARGIGIGIRGVGNNVTDENTFVNAVGVYMDGFSVAAVPTGIVNPQLQDVERIEVLRGPQGTYFGRNAVGGALNLTTVKPHFDGYEGEIIVGAETFEDAGEQFGVTGILNIPLTNTLAARGVIYFEDSSGLVENVNPGGNDSDHQYLTGRLSVRWQPTDATLVDFLMLHSDEEQGSDESVPSGVWDLDTVETFGVGCDGTMPTCQGGGVSGITAPVDANILNGSPIGFWPNNRNQTSRDRDERNDNTTTVAILNISHQVNEELVLKSVTGIIGTTNERVFDNDLLGGGNSLAATGVAQGDAIRRENDQQGTSWSTELRAELTKDRYDLVVGFMYAKDEINRQNGVRRSSQGIVAVPGGGFIFPPPPAIGPDGTCLGCNKKNFELESFAVFADATWHYNDQLDLTFGFRYTNDDVLNELNNSQQLRPSGSNEENFTDFAPRFVIGYQINDDVRVYGNISKGYKAGGTALNYDSTGPTTVVTVAPFKEETLWNYELGIKSQWYENRLRANAAVFLTKWTDMQLESFRFLIPGMLSTNIEEVVQVDDAEAWGFELELAAAVTDRLTMTGSLGYLSTDITCACPATIKANSPVILDGTDLPRSPELTLAISAEYRMPMFAGEGWIRADYFHRDEQATDIEGTTFEQTRDRVIPSGLGFAPAIVDGFPYIAPSHDVVNLRAGYDHGSNWRVNVFIENLFDEEYFTGTQEDFGLSGFRLRPHPRIFGGSVSYAFGQ